jgi:hypothetical protein
MIININININNRWTLSAGLLTSPLLALPQLLLWACPAPKDASPAAYAEGQRALATGYTLMFLLSLAEWVANVTVVRALLLLCCVQQSSRETCTVVVS